VNSTKFLAAVGVVAIIIAGVYFINESGKSDLDKLGDSIENAADDVADAVKD
jgi:uncharacterized protein (UPF0333 family)